MSAFIGTEALQRWQAAGTSISLGPHKYFYRDQGKGQVLLMPHGFPMSSWDWKDMFEPLTKTFRVIAPDFLGCGFSDKPETGDYSTRAHAQMLFGLLGALQVTDVHILTYSFGCSVTQEMLSRTMRDGGLNIRTVTLMNGGIFPASNHPNPTQLALLSPKGPEIAQGLTRRFLDDGLPPIFGPETQPSEELISDYWNLLNLNDGHLRLPQLIGYLHDRTTLAEAWRNALIHHPAKKQLIVGMIDDISGPKMAEEYRNTVPDPRIMVLDRIGHYPQIEAPEIVIDAVKRFIEEDP
jgi:pimeloyl-ACP methyl ester carboxylesterase